MPLLFQTRPGQVVRMDDPAIQCSAIDEERRATFGLDPSITFNVERSIVTRIAVSQSTNVQFLHTLGSQVFIYVFGDRIGTIGLSGLSFICACDGDIDTNGPEQIFLWYKRNRVSQRQTPVRLIVGSEVIEGFVTGHSFEVVDPSLTLTQWNLELMSLPEVGEQRRGAGTAPPAPPTAPPITTPPSSTIPNSNNVSSTIDLLPVDDPPSTIDFNFGVR